MKTYRRFAFRTSDQRVAEVLDGIHKDRRSAFVEKVLVMFIQSEKGQAILDFVTSGDASKSPRADHKKHVAQPQKPSGFVTKKDRTRFEKPADDIAPPAAKGGATEAAPGILGDFLSDGDGGE